MLCHVALVRTDISKEPIASIMKVTGIGELETTLAVTSNQRMLWSKVISFSKTRATWHNISEDSTLHSYRCENPKSYRLFVLRVYEVGSLYFIWYANLHIISILWHFITDLLITQQTTKLQYL
jgi:hypothetical protein